MGQQHPLPHVAKLLEHFRDSGRLLRLFLGVRETGRDWMEKNDMVGYVGRSSGSQKVPLLIQPGEDGGTTIPTDSIATQRRHRSACRCHNPAVSHITD